MQIIGDFHLHSKYARACSKNLDLQMLEKYARIKGIHVLGTGDFQHPLWMKELKAGLTEEDGILRSATGFPFILQTEISLIYSQGGKGRRVHNLIFSPNMETADQIIEALGRKGRLDYDGRPIFGFSCIELMEMMQDIDKNIEIIPAHAWTPWFSVFGSNSGFDSLQECFEEKTPLIHAIETGLSSDPAMNWRISSLDGIQMVSFSDAHSFWPNRMGREVTQFDIPHLRYDHFLRAIRTGEGLVQTIEVNPAYGKYHWDGHRLCNVVLSPQDSLKQKNMCPVCKRKLTIGVEHRVEELADRESGIRPAGAKPFLSLLPLPDIISSIRGGTATSKKVMEDYYKLIAAFGDEFTVLLKGTIDKLENVVDKKIAQMISDVRERKIHVTPGYDGVYGEIVFPGKETIKIPSPRTQMTLGDFKQEEV